jgi:glycosyltransferase involved in cell wall biosynthesis
MKVSVIVTSFNYGKFLRKAIRSILEQDYPRDRYEILIVDAGSTDNTPEVLREYASEIKVIHQIEKSGLAGGCNLGIRASMGEFIIRLDADDTLCRNALSVQAELLEQNPQIGFVYPDYYVLRDGEKTRVHLPAFDPDEIYERGDFLGGGMMYRKSVFDAFGLYDESLRSIENYEFILRILGKGVRGLHVAQPIFVYLQHGASMSDDQAAMCLVWNILEQRFGRPFGFGKYHPRKLFE